jgi:hypothetical protein
MLVFCLAAMPRYFFDLRNDPDARDDEGRELPDLAAARETALEAARDMACADIRNGELNLNHAIDVTDAQGATLFTITFRDAFDIKGI